jgi:signal transduction histidine kinase
MVKILLVDDREDNLTSIESILQQDGYQFIKANSGAQALKVLLTEYDFALILMDVKMPNLNGFDTASLIYAREKLRHIPIIFITAFSYDEEHIFKGYRSGAVDYIYKPINPDILRAKVAVFIELYGKTHQLALQEQKLTAINKSLENEIKERTVSEENVKQLNLMLLQNIDKLEAANKDLDSFAFIASHDLQEPLRKIQTFISRIEKNEISNISEIGKEYFTKMKSSADRMRDLIDNLLMYSRTNTEEQVFEHVELKEVLENAMQELSLIIEEKNAIINYSSLPKLNLLNQQFQQLLVNLIGNSLKYAKEDVTPVIQIGSKIVKPKDVPGIVDGADKVFHRITISDNGIGFDQKFANNIFVLFQRLHEQNEYSGTGIGLAICKKIIENHRGVITAEGKPGIGSTFNIFLPQAIAN